MFIFFFVSVLFSSSFIVENSPRVRVLKSWTQQQKRQWDMLPCYYKKKNTTLLQYTIWKHFYFPRKFTSIILAGLYILPQANTLDVHMLLSDQITPLGNSYPNSSFIILGGITTPFLHSAGRIGSLFDLAHRYGTVYWTQELLFFALKLETLG